MNFKSGLLRAVFASALATGSVGCFGDTFQDYHLPETNIGGDVISFEEEERYDTYGSDFGLIRVLRPGNSLESFEIRGVNGEFKKVLRYCRITSEDFKEVCSRKREYISSFDDRARGYLDKITQYKLSKLGVEGEE